MNKKTLILGGVLIALIALAYAYQGPLKKWQESLGESKNFLAKINIDEVDKIEVAKDGDTTILEKSGDRLRVGGTKDFYVSQSLADNLFKYLKEAGEGDFELISTNKDKKDSFETGDNGIYVKLFSGDEEKADFIIGKMSSDFSSTYVSMSDSDNTYSVKANLYGPFMQPEWRDRTIFKSNKENISKIRFQYPDREFAVEKIEEKWEGVSPYKFLVDEEKVDEIVNMMSNLSATQIPEQNFEGTGLEKHNIIVQATGEDLDSTLMIGDDNGEELYFAKKGDSDNIYLISKTQRDELDKKLWDLK